MTIVQRVMQGYHYIFYELSVIQRHEYGFRNLFLYLCNLIFFYTTTVQQTYGPRYDPRTQDWWLVPGPGPLLTIMVTYLYFCKKAGPKFMKGRKPYNLKTVVMWYNVVQVLLNSFLCGVFLHYILTEKYTNKCYVLDYTTTPSAVMLASAVWWFYISKITELLDTVFFVLRKKNRQITFLHLYHHTIMPIISFMAVKYAPGRQTVLEGALNSFVHVLMYTYYLLSGLGPQYQKYVWWKKYLTNVQLIQFCIGAFLNVNSLLSSSCNHPKPYSLLLLFNCCTLFFLFVMYYHNNYINAHKDKKCKTIVKKTAEKEQ